MKVLVTGSTGFIGGALCRALSAGGYEVHAFHRPSSVVSLLDGLPVKHILGDLAQPESLAAAMEGIDLVYHCAALLNPSGQPGRMYTVTVEGTRNVLAAAQRAGVRRVVHTSSIAALGAPVPPRRKQDAPALIDEHHTWNLPPERWPYGYAKYLAEMEVQQACARGLDCVIVNPGLVIGAGDIYRQTSALVVLSASGKLTASIEGGLNVVHIKDVIAGHLAAAERGKTGERYILGGHNLTLYSLIKTAAAITGAAAPRVQIPARVAHLAARPMGWLSPFLPIPIDPAILSLAGYYFYCSNRKAQMELQLAPPRSVENALEDALEWFRQSGVIASSPNRPASPPDN